MLTPVIDQTQWLLHVTHISTYLPANSSGLVLHPHLLLILQLFEHICGGDYCTSAGMDRRTKTVSRSIARLLWQLIEAVFVVVEALELLKDGAWEHQLYLTLRRWCGRGSAYPSQVVITLTVACMYVPPKWFLLHGYRWCHG